MKQRTATFHSNLTFAKDNSKLGAFISTASKEDTLQDLRNLLPDEKELEDSPDLGFWAANAAVLGLGNLNGISMTPEVGVALSKTAKNKALNWNHDRSVNIGFINSVAFSSFPDNRLISELEAETSDICNLVLGGVFWKIVHDGLSTELEFFDDPESPWFHDLSLSWEVAYSEWAIQVGPKKISDSRIITDEKEKEEYSKYLRYEGGDGFDPEGNEVSILITDKNAIFLSVGCTMRPAAAVRGIVTGSKPTKEENSSISVELAETLAKLDEKMQELQKKVEENENIFSQPQKNIVKPINMKKIFADVDQFHQYVTSAGADLQRLDVETFLLQETEKAAKEYTNKLDTAAAELEKAKNDTAETKQKLSAAETELSTLKTKIAELEEKVEADRKQTVLAARIGDLSEKFDLSDASVRKAVAKQIKDLNEPDFENWMKEDEIGGILLASHPKKESKAAADPEAAAKALKETKASTVIPNAEEVEKGLDLENIIKHITPKFK